MQNIKHALITGASRGIGRAIAEKLGQAGYELHLICRQNIASLDGISGHHYCGDVGDPDFIKSVFSHLSGLDLLINNAGIAYRGLLQDMELSEWEMLMRTNLTGVFLCCREAIPIMLRQGHGKIINISSIWGSAGSSMEAAYSASKGAVNALTRSLAKELGPSNIQVNAIACGLIDTDMNGNLSEEEKRDLIELIPACRMGSPEDVAELVRSLSDGNDYLTGQVITLDGGWM